MQDGSTRKIQCRNCGALLSYAPSIRSLACEFCGAVVELLREDEIVPAPGEIRSIVPLTVDAGMLEQVAHRYMVSGKFTPDDLIEKAVIVRKTLSYVPAYIFSGTYTAQWTASFGYDRTEQYVEYRNGKPDTRRQVVTDWKPVNGVDAGRFSVPVYGGNLLDEEVVGLVEGIGLEGRLTDLSDGYLAGFEAEAFVLRPREAFDAKGQSGINKVIDRQVMSHAQGDRQRDWHWTAQLDRTTIPALLPLAHCVFEYSGKSYHIRVDGSDESRVVCDPLPEDNGKRSSIAIGYLPLALGATAVVAASFLHLHVFNPYTLAALLLAGGYAWLRKTQQLAHSKTVRAALLAHKTASKANAAQPGTADREAIISGINRPAAPLFADRSRDKLLLPLLSLLCIAMVFVSSLVTKENRYEGRDEHERVIASFVEAEDRRDYGELSGYLATGMRRYWDIYQPTPRQIEKRYGHIWSITEYSKNEIRDIDRVNDSTYVLRTRYEYKGNRSKRTAVLNSRVCFVFGSDLKLRELYGLD
jgi:hypothetical protein